MAWDKQVRADKIRLAALKQTTNFVFMVQKSIADFDFFECKNPISRDKRSWLIGLLVLVPIGHVRVVWRQILKK